MHLNKGPSSPQGEVANTQTLALARYKKAFIIVFDEGFFLFLSPAIDYLLCFCCVAHVSVQNVAEHQNAAEQRKILA
jgi:hypothetical protein